MYDDAAGRGLFGGLDRVQQEKSHFPRLPTPSKRQHFVVVTHLADEHILDLSRTIPYTGYRTECYT